MGVLQNGWLIRENHIKMDDLGVPLFQETSIYWYLWISMGNMTMNMNIDPQWLSDSLPRREGGHFETTCLGLERYWTYTTPKSIGENHLFPIQMAIWSHHFCNQFLEIILWMTQDDPNEPRDLDGFGCVPITFRQNFKTNLNFKYFHSMIKFFWPRILGIRYRPI
jgi:hypothetical protein